MFNLVWPKILKSKVLIRTHACTDWSQYIEYLSLVSFKVDFLFVMKLKLFVFIFLSSDLNFQSNYTDLKDRSCNL